MKDDTTHSTIAQPEAETAAYLFDDWFDPIEAGVRERVREFIEAMIEGELDATLPRPRYGGCRRPSAAAARRCGRYRPPPRPPVAVADWEASAGSRSRCRAPG